MHTTTLGRRHILEVASPTSALTVLHAPSGWGKSTLLRESHQALHAAGRPSLWLTLEEGQSATDLKRALSDALDCLPAAPGANSGDLRRATSAAEARNALDVHLSARPDLTIHLDGLERLGEQVHWVWDLLVTLATHHPLSRILASTRWLTDELARRLRMTPGVAVLGSDALSFTPDDVERLLTGATGETPERALVEHVHASTQGCPRTVVSALVEAEPGTAPHRIDWRAVHAAGTWEELDRLGVLPLVRRTAWLPRLDVDLVSSLAGVDRSTAADALTALERSGHGTWSTTSSGTTTFTYTRSLRGLLASARLTTPHAGIDEEHARQAVDWLADHGELGEALVLALRTRQLPRATETYRRMLVSQPTVFPDGFENALRDVPPGDLIAHPLLAVARGVALLDSPSTRDVAMRLLGPVANRDPASFRGDSPDDELMELTSQSVVLRLLGRIGESARVAMEAARRLQDPAYATRVEPALFTPLVCQLSQSLFEAGHVSGAQALIALGSAWAPTEQLHFWGLYGRAFYALDGRIRAAEDVSAHVDGPAARAGAVVAGISWGRRTRVVDQVGAGALLLDQWQFDAALERTPEIPGTRWGTSAVWSAWVRLHASLGRGTHATEVVRTHTAVESAPSRPQTLGHAALANVMTVAWLATGNVVRARRAHVSVDAYPGQTAPAALLLATSCGGPEAALNRLPELREAEGHTVRSRAALETVGCAIALRTGASEYAAHLLEEVAAMNDEHGCRAHLLYLSQEDREAVQHLARSLQSAAVDRLLEGLERSAALPSSPSQVALSPRELAVLRALASHRSRADVAVALHVSENTVKSQLRSVYRKLEVTTREEAILRASELDLLGREMAHA